MEGTYDQLIRKLDQFIRKYYRNQIVRGAIYSLLLLLSYFIIISLIEHFGRFGSFTRGLLFYSSIILTGFVLFRLVIVPILHLFRIGKLISHNEAARIIGKHFPEVEDRLLNVLQLKHTSIGSRELIEASIDQKSAQLSPVPFQNAIDLRRNLRYARYLLAPLMVVILLLLLGQEEIFTKSPQRIVNYTEEFVEAAPFDFVILNESLDVYQNNDFSLHIKLEGEEIPETCYLEWNGMNYRMKKQKDGTYAYAFKKVREDQMFRLQAAGFNSKYHELHAYPVPELVQFEMHVDYPSYTGISDEVLTNTGDLRLPYGSRVKWILNTRNTDEFELLFGDSLIGCERASVGVFSFERPLYHSVQYRFVPRNEYLEQEAGIHQIEVVEDAYPSIQMVEEADSTDDRLRFFTLNCEDDYGFSALYFHYRKNGEEETIRQEVQINRNVARDQSFHYWNLREEGLELGDEIEYFFELWDNDGIHGPKSSRTESRVFHAPTRDELKEKTNADSEEIQEKMQESIEKARDIQEQLEELNRKMLEKKELSWEEKKQLEELLKQQKELQKEVEEIMEESKKLNEQRSEFQDQSERILEKQRQLEQLFEEMMDEEMQKLLEEMEKLLDEIDKDQLQEHLEEMELSNEELEKELDRNLELFKQMEFEQKLEESIDELERLAEEQEKLAEESQDPSSDPEELQQKQEELNEKFEEWQKEMDELEKKNQELERPNQMQDTEEKEKSIEEDMKESSEELNKKNSKKASQKQKEASEQMEEMAEQMKQMQNQMSSQQQGEDMESLRQILDNLVTLSIDQEKLMDELLTTNRNDPRYVELIREQNKLKDDSRIIEDSLFALSKRVLQIQSMINQEMGAINENMDKAVEFMAERNSPEALNRQQYVMTSANNLALMLSEVLEQMQKQMAQMMQGSQACENPGQGQPSMSEMRKKQEQLNQQMKDIQGQNPQGDKPGDQKGDGKNGKGKNSKELARLAAQQEALRRQLREMADEMMNSEEGVPGALGDALQKMEETERDLVNDQITQETLKRQEEILTRLLEAEEAEREQDWDNKRESIEAGDLPERTPDAFLEYQKMKERQAEMLQTVPADLQPFYKKLVDKYFSSSQ